MGNWPNPEFAHDSRLGKRWLIAAGFVAAAVAIRLIFNPILKDQAPYLFFALATMLSARYAGAFPGIAAAIVGAIVGNFLFVPVAGTFDLTDGRQFIGVGAYLLVCGVAIAICESLRRATWRAELLALHADANAEDLRREINNRAKVEDLLRDSEKRYRFLAESIPQIVWTARPDGVTNYNNQWMFDYFGATREQMQKTGWVPFRHADDRAAATARWQHSIKTGEQYECTYRLLRASDQSWRWHLARAVPMRDEAGEIVLWFGTCVDIDDSKRAEHALRASEQEFRAVFDLAGSGKALADPKTGRFVRVNRKLCEMTGYTSDELRTMGYLDITHPDDRESTRDGAGRLMRGEANEYTAEKRYLRKDGETIWVHVTATMIYDADGKPLHAAGVIQDITQRRRAEQALRESEAFFRTMGEAVPDFIWSADADGRVVYFNWRWEEYTGLTVDQFNEQGGWTRVHHPDELDSLLLDLERAAQGTEPAHFECRLRRRDGVYRWFMGRTATVRDPASNDSKIVRWVGTLTDIDDRKRIEAELRAANRAKDQFLATLSHELRTPLTPVVLTLGAMLDDPALPAHLRDDLHVIERNVGLETKLIDDLLDLTRIARGKLQLRPRLVDVHTMLEHAVRSCCGSDAHDRQLDVRIERRSEHVHVRADPHRLDQIFFNLLRNAVKFTPPGGQIRVATESPRDGWLAVHIADTGIGIERDAMSRIFNAFEQGDPSVTRQFGGLGLGLAVSRALLDLHGGTIRAESAGRDRGATFIVELPLADPALVRGSSAPNSNGSGTAGAHASNNGDALRSSPLKILLVEDHNQTAQIMTRLLRATNHAVIAAGDVRSAKQLAETNEFDLVVSDLGLPDGSGLELMHHLRERFGLRGIALTGFGMEDDVRQSKAAGFIEHLVKPVAFSDLEAAIARVAQSPAQPPAPSSAP